MRISSEGLQKRSFVVGAPLVEDEFPDRLALYMPDGTPIDLVPNPSKMVWRGTWSDVETTYALHDVVAFAGGLYIYMGAESPAVGASPIADGTEWVNMASSSAMRFGGEWEPRAFQINDVVTRDNKLWIANQNIFDTPFSFVASDWASQYGGSETISVTVPEETQVGDVMIWAGAINHYAKRQRPSDYLDWTELSSDGITDETTPPGHTDVFAKVVTEDDLGTDKVSTENSGDYGTVQLLVFRGAGIPIAAEIDVLKSRNDSLPTPLTVVAGADPAETQPEDKVVRIFLAQAQNFAIDSGNNPSFSAGADTQDELIFDVHEIYGGGSYWADAAAGALASFTWSSGEHKYVLRYSLRMPSPIGFNLDQWDMIGILEGGDGGGGGGAADGGFKGNWDADTDYVAGDVVRAGGILYGTVEDVTGTDPTAIAGSDFGTVRVGIQGTTLDKLDDGVTYVKEFTADTPLDSNSKRAIPLMLDAADGSVPNVTMTIDNDTDSQVTFYINGSGGASDGVYSLASGSTFTDKPVRFASYWGTGNPAMILVEGDDADILGTITVTITSPEDLDPPDVPNPWTALTESIPDIQALHDATQHNSSSTSYVYSGSAQIVIPADGDYEVAMSAWLAIDNATSGNEVRAGVAVDGTVDAGATMIKSALESPAYAVNSHATVGRVLTLDAGDVIRPMFKVVGSGLAYIEEVKILVRPVNVA
jgi:hypothetical protein